MSFTAASSWLSLILLWASSLVFLKAASASDSELRARVILLEAALEQMKTENSALRARLDKLERERREEPARGARGITDRAAPTAKAGGDSVSSPKPLNRSGGTGTKFLDTRDKSNWRKLKIGMAAEQVEAMFGPPKHVRFFGFGDSGIAWEYSDRVSDCVVNFHAATMTVVSWSEPN